MANWFGGASTIMTCIQYEASSEGLPNYVSTLSSSLNGTTTGYISAMVTPHVSGLPSWVSVLANKKYVYSKEWMVCGGRNYGSGLWNSEFLNYSSVLNVTQPGVRKCFIGIGMMPMWLASHKHSNDCRIRARFIVRNKSGEILWQTAAEQTWFFWDRPERIPSNGARLESTPTVGQDIGSITIEWSAWTDDNKWHDLGDRSNPLSWTPSFSMGGLRSVHFSSLYPYWNDSRRGLITYTDRTVRY